MNLEAKLEEDMIQLFHLAGELVGYHGTRYLQAILNKGGLKTAKRMLEPRTKGQRSGLDTILEAGYPELTLEFVVLKEQYWPDPRYPHIC